MNDRVDILCGDALTVLRELPSGIARCCVTSPPYFGLRSYVPDGDPKKPLEIGMEPTPEEYVAKLVAVFAEVRRVLADDGVCFIVLGDSYAREPAKGGSGPYNGRNHPDTGYGGGGPVPPGLKPKDLVGIPWRVAFALQADGWWLRCDIIWEKPNGMCSSVTDRPTITHEYVFMLAKSERYFFNQEAVKEPAMQPIRSGKLTGQLKRAQLQKLNSYTLGTNQGSRTRNIRSVWRINTASYNGAHFATYPPALVAPCILAGSVRGDLVLDPFCGSGTTGEVALKHGRRFLGIELNPEYVDLSWDRLNPILSQPQLELEESEPEPSVVQMSMFEEFDNA